MDKKDKIAVILSTVAAIILIFVEDYKYAFMFGLVALVGYGMRIYKSFQKQY